MIKYILAALACGTIVGYSNSKLGDVFPNRFVSYYLFNACLVFLLFVMGFALGADKGAAVKMRKAGLKILVLPMTIALGSIVGGIVGGLLLRIDLYASAAVSAGYGWYTLAGPLMGQMFGPEWSALGFMVNFLRELLTIVTVSVIVRVDKYAPIALGGATTMDTTLPVIVRYCGSDALMTAFTSGFTLSLMAPLTIIAIASLR